MDNIAKNRKEYPQVVMNMHIAVVGPDADRLCRLADLNAVCFPDVSSAASRRWDLLALTQGMSALTEGAAPLPAPALRAAHLLLPEGAALPVEAAQAVDYGLSARNTLTLSSLTGPTRLLCLQRSFYNLRGELLEPQELPLAGVAEGLDAWQALFLAGLLIFCSPAGSAWAGTADRTGSSTKASQDR